VPTVTEEGVPQFGQPDPVGTARAGPDAAEARRAIIHAVAEARAQAAAEERRWLARELHDGITQDLAALGYALDEVIADADQADSDVAAALTDLRGRFTESLRALRQILGGLRSGPDVGEGLGAALEAAARRIARRSGWQLHLSLRQPGARLPVDAEAELFRIGHEALINAAKHAQAGNVWLTCHVDPPSALLRVADDGVGVGGNRMQSDSYGFVTMRERAHLLGASLSVEEHRGTGTSVEVRLASSSGRESAAGGS
jgi:signal transduction histidine kinase